MKAAVVKENYLDTLRAIDPELVKTAVSGPRFQQCFFENCRDKRNRSFRTPDYRLIGLFQTGLHHYAGLFVMVVFLLDTVLPASRVRCSVSIIPTKQISAIKTNAKRKLIPGRVVRFNHSLNCSPMRMPMAPRVIPSPTASCEAVLNSVLA